MEEVTELMLSIESNTLAVGGITMSHNGEGFLSYADGRDE